MTSRREVVIGSLAALGAAATRAAPYPPSLAFAAFRNGVRIGEQTMQFTADADSLEVRTRADFAVKLGPLTLFRYRHQAVERWRGGRFESLETHTDAGGKRQSVNAERSPAEVVISSDALRTPFRARPDILPFTHWNRAIVRAPLFNPQTGALLHLTASSLGRGPVALAGGTSIMAERIGFTGEVAIDDWYDDAARWTALRGRLADGSTLDYRRM